jgi:hypothetical protein
MERDFGAEIVRTFGARLRRIYDSDDQGLPEPMATCLEQLARAEKQQEERPVCIQSQPQQAGDDRIEGPQNGFSVRFPMPTSS